METGLLHLLFLRHQKGVSHQKVPLQGGNGSLAADAARLECRGARLLELLYAAYGVEMRPPFFVFSCKKEVNAVAMDMEN